MAVDNSFSMMWDAPIQIPRSLQCTKVRVHLPLTHCRIARQLGSRSYICILTVIELKVCGKLGFFCVELFCPPFLTATQVLLWSSKFWCLSQEHHICQWHNRDDDKVRNWPNFNDFKCSFQNQFLTHSCIIVAYQGNNDLERECRSEISEPH